MTRSSRPEARRRTTSRAQTWADDSGAATVLAAAVIAALVTVLIGVVFVGGAVVARHRAQAGADLAALAGAQRLVMALDDPCGAARSLAERMSVRIARCAVDGQDVVVTAVDQVDLGPFGARTAQARARAGPVT